MADFTATTLLEYRIGFEQSMAGEMGQQVLRRDATRVAQSMMDGSALLLPGGQAQVDAMKQSTQRTGEILVMKPRTDATRNARGCSGSGRADSAKFALSWQYVGADFELIPLLHDNNELSFQNAYNHEMAEAQKKIMQKIDTLSVAFLEANKGTNGGTYSATNFNSGQNYTKILTADNDEFFNIMQTEMHENNFESDHYINVHKMYQIRETMRLANQGAGNADNLQYQLAAFKQYGSNKVANPTGDTFKHSSFVFVPGTVGMFQWINLDFRRGGTNGIDTWTTVSLPSLGSCEMKIKDTCEDRSGTYGSGFEAARVLSCVIGLEICFLSAYETGTNTGIYKYAQQA